MNAAEAAREAGIRVIPAVASYYLHSKMEIGLETGPETEFALAHEMGHHLGWVMGSVQDRCRTFGRIWVQRTEARPASVWGVPLPHIPKADRRKYRRQIARLRGADPDMTDIRERHRRQEEREAWDLGEQYISPQERAAYWECARRCLATYGVAI